MGNVVERVEARDAFRRTTIASLLALAAVLSTPRGVDRRSATLRLAAVPVVVAARDMPQGAAIDRTALVVAQWPAGTIPAGAFTSIDSVAGRVTRLAVFKGAALVPGRLAPAGTGAGLEVRITPGKWAMSFRINDVSGIAGLVQPNSRVDILVVMDGGKKGRAASLFMENMRVLAIGSVPERADDGRPINGAVATVEVTPEEGERLAIATTQGQIQLMLRGYGDLDSISTSAAVANDVLTDIKRSRRARSRALTP